MIKLKKKGTVFQNNDTKKGKRVEKKKVEERGKKEQNKEQKENEL